MKKRLLVLSIFFLLIADIENAIRLWIDLLADEKYLEAFEFTLHNQYLPFDWTPTVIEQLINGYGEPWEDDGTPKNKVTKWSATLDNGRKHYKEINLYDTPKKEYYDDPNFMVIGDVLYNLPLDFEWSDLSVTFNILQSQPFTTLELDQIHCF